MVLVKRDNETQASFNSGDDAADQNAAWLFILKNQPMSVDWAIRYEGWEITTA